eukprot:729495-Hanusia_phi.AAC.1
MKPQCKNGRRVLMQHCHRSDVVIGNTLLHAKCFELYESGSSATRKLIVASDIPKKILKIKEKNAFTSNT